MLGNTLIKHHNISEAAAQDAANNFIESAIQVGVLGDNRVLKYAVTISTLSKTQYAEVIDESVKDEGRSDNQIVKLEPVNYSSSNDIKVPIHLTKNKMAYMVYPSDINDKDIKLLEHAIKGILLRLELEKDGAENNIKKEE